MSDSFVMEQLREGLAAGGLGEQELEELASQLLWRIGRAEGEERITVRAGFASSAGLFQTLPKLRSVQDAEIEAAVKEGELKFEWVGPRLRPTAS